MTKLVKSRRTQLIVLALFALAVALFAGLGLPIRDPNQQAEAASGGNVTYYTLTVYIEGPGQVNVNPPNTTVSVAVSTFSYVSGTVVGLTAIPNSGQTLYRWEQDLTGREFAQTLTMTTNRTVRAVFGTNTVTLTTATSPAGTGGTVTPAGTTNQTYGSTVNLTATNSSTHYFNNWTGDITSASNPASIVMLGSKSVTANFLPKPVLTTVVNPAGAGSVSPVAGVKEMNSVQSLAATPVAGYRFGSWSGDLTGTTMPTNLTMNANKSVTANFIRQYMLTTSTTGSGTGTISPSSGTYDTGTVVSVSATPAAGSRFGSWSGAATGTITPVSVTMNADKALTATFVKQYTLTTSAVGSGTISPASGTYDTGTVVSLTATPVAGWRFVAWSGGATGPTNPLSVTMSANKAITATFVQTYTLSTTATGSGTVSPASGTYDTGTVVSLAATPSAGWRFGSWSGGATGTTTPVNVTMNANKSVNATFIQQFNLTTSVTGQGSVNPASGTYDIGAVVPVTATAASGWVFDHWEGAATGSANPVNVTMNAAKSLTAVFVEKWELSVGTRNVGAASGTVVPASALYAPGATATIVATPDAGSAFAYWEDAASGEFLGAYASIDIAMTEDRYLIGVFVPDTHVLVTAWVANDRGDITFDPAPVGAIESETVTDEAGTTWTTHAALFPVDSYVEVTIAPDAGFEHQGWTTKSGSLLSAPTECSLTCSVTSGQNIYTRPGSSVVTYEDGLDASAKGIGYIISDGIPVHLRSPRLAGTIQPDGAVLRAVAGPYWTFSHWEDPFGNTLSQEVEIESATALGKPDVNGDGVVDDLDLELLWRGVFEAEGKSGGDTDMDSDGDTDIDDYNMVVPYTHTHGVFAVFTANTLIDLTVSTFPPETGEVQVGTLAVSDTIALPYGHGEIAVLTAVERPGFMFSHWEGDVTGNSTSVAVTMDSTASVQAVFTSNSRLRIALKPVPGQVTTAARSAYTIHVPAGGALIDPGYTVYFLDNAQVEIDVTNEVVVEEVISFDSDSDSAFKYYYCEKTDLGSGQVYRAEAAREISLEDEPTDAEIAAKCAECKSASDDFNCGLFIDPDNTSNLICDTGQRGSIFREWSIQGCPDSVCKREPGTISIRSEYEGPSTNLVDGGRIAAFRSTDFTKAKSLTSGCATRELPNVEVFVSSATISQQDTNVNNVVLNEVYIVPGELWYGTGACEWDGPNLELVGLYIGDDETNRINEYESVGGVRYWAVQFVPGELVEVRAKWGAPNGATPGELAYGQDGCGHVRISTPQGNKVLFEAFPDPGESFLGWKVITEQIQPKSDGYVSTDPFFVYNVPPGLRSTVRGDFTGRCISLWDDDLYSNDEEAPDLKGEPDCFTQTDLEENKLDPVYLHNGEFYEEIIDVNVPGRQIDFEWKRFYRSRMGKSDPSLPKRPMGEGWDHSYNIFLIRNSKDDLILYSGKNRRDIYRKRMLSNEPVDFRWIDGEQYSEITEEDGQLVLRKQCGFVYYFYANGAHSGKLEKIRANESPEAPEMTFTYDSTNRLTTITDTLGRVFSVNYATISDESFVSGVSMHYGGNTYPLVSYEYTSHNPKLNRVLDPINTQIARYEYAQSTDNIEKVWRGVESDPYLVNKYGTSIPEIDRVIQQTWGKDGEDIWISYQPKAHVSFAEGLEFEKQFIVRVRDRHGFDSTYEYERGNLEQRMNRLIKRTEYLKPVEIAVGPFTDDSIHAREDRVVTTIRYTDTSYISEIVTEMKSGSDSTLGKTSVVYEYNDGIADDTSVRRLIQGKVKSISRHYDYDDGHVSTKEEFFYGYAGDRVSQVTHRNVLGQETTLLYNSGSQITDIIYPGGNELNKRDRFLYNSVGTLLSHISPANGSGYTRKDTFDEGLIQDGKIIKTVVQDDDGPKESTTTFEQDIFGRTVNVKDARGSITEFIYDARGRLAWIVYPPVNEYAKLPTTGTDVNNDGVISAADIQLVINAALGYDVSPADADVNNDSLVNSTDVQLVINAAIATPGFVQYRQNMQYNASNYMVRATIETLKGGIAVTSTSTVFEHDLLGHVKRSTEDVGGESPVVSDYVYDADHLVEIFTGERPLAQGALPSVSYSNFDYEGRPRQVEVGRGTSMPLVKVVEYGFEGRIKSAGIKAGNGNIVRQTEYTYESPFGPTAIVDAQGNTYEFEYNANGNITKTSLLSEENGAKAFDVTYQFDARDRIAYVLRKRIPMPTGVGEDEFDTTAFTYTPLSEIKTVTTDSGRVFSYIYDTANRLERVTDPSGNTCTYEYDAVGNLVTETLSHKPDGSQTPNTFITRMKYDGLNRTTEVELPGARKHNFGYDARGHITRYGDAIRMQTNEFSAHDVRFDYDNLGRIIKESTDKLRFGDGKAIEDPIVLQFDWDKSSRLKRSVDGRGVATVYDYDELDRITEVRDGVLSPYEVGGDVRESYTYNEFGDVETVTERVDGASRTYSYQYDAAGVVDTITQEARQDTFKFDALGRVIDATVETTQGPNSGSLVRTEFAYDTLGNLISDRVTDDGTVLWDVSANYDSGGRATKVVYPESKWVTYGYDNRGCLTNVDANWNSIHAEYEYQRPGIVRKRILQTSSGGTETTYNFEPQNGMPDSGAISKVTHSAEGGSSIFDVTRYEYDKMGNLANKYNETSGGNQAWQRHNYIYDNANRLREHSVQYQTAGGPFVDELATDVAGNRENHVTNLRNEVTNTPADIRTYDDYGNLKTVVSNTGTKSFQHDDRNQMVSYTDEDGVTTEYKYDVFGRRIAKRRQNVESKFTYLGWTMLEENKTTEVDANTTNFVKKRFVYGQDFTDPIAMTKGDGVSFLYHADPMGNVTSLTNGAGVVQERYDYGAYGDPTVMDAAWSPLADPDFSLKGNPFNFTGQQYDTESALYYLRNRYMEPATGRFVTPDPLGAWADPYSYGNAYTYAGNNPATMSDPMGLMAEHNGGAPGVGDAIDPYAATLALAMQGGANAEPSHMQVDFHLRYLRSNEALSSMERLRWHYRCWISDGLHTGLAVAGLTEGPGSFADIADGVLYMIEGDIRSAGAAFLCSLPAVGAALRLAMMERRAASLAMRGLDKVADMETDIRQIGEVLDDAKILCFASGTLVHTKDGPVPIEEVDVGTEVASKDETTGEVVWGEVSELFCNQNQEVLEVSIVDASGEDDDIWATSEHPFWVVGEGWVDAGNLDAGDDILCIDGSTVDVLTIESTKQRQTTYNLEVQDLHTYFVGENGLWVHNQCDVTKADGRYYSVAFETRLDPSLYPNKPRYVHDRYANKKLQQAMKDDSYFAKQMDELGIQLVTTPRGLVSHSPPPGWSWHHDAVAGTVQLVQRSDNSFGSKFFKRMHPGGRGGYSRWGKK